MSDFIYPGSCCHSAKTCAGKHYRDHIAELETERDELKSKLHYRTLQWEGVKNMLAEREGTVAIPREVVELYVQSMSSEERLAAKRLLIQATVKALEGEG